jgi:hypothetical protein
MTTFRTALQLQKAFDRWRHIYNSERPHQALNYDVPSNRYRPSSRSLPGKLREPEYEEGAIVRRASSQKANFRFGKRRWSVPEAFRGEPLAIRPLATDGRFGAFFGAHQIACIDLRNDVR